MGRYIPTPSFEDAVNGDFYLYHYSAEKYRDIRSKVAQKAIVPDSNPMQYGKSVSFFLGPIPRDIATIWNNELVHWKKGMRLFEYVVKVSSLPEHIPYVLTESTEKTDLLYNKQKWYEGMPQSLIDKNIADIRALEKRLGYIGTGRDALLELCNGQTVDLAADYRLSRKIHLENPEDKIDQKYAASVPHLMLYPAETPLQFFEVNPITLK